MSYWNRRAGTKMELLRAIRESTSISKAMLAKELKLSKPAVAENIRQLIEAGIIIETGEGEASRTGGRKPVMLEINSDHRYTIAIDLGRMDPVCAIGNLDCELLQEEVLLVPAAAAADERLERVKKAIERLLLKQQTDRSRLGCIVISTPGVVSKDDDIYLVNEQHRRWTSIHLKEYLEAEYKVTVLQGNDVNMALVAEMELGRGRTRKNMVYISCGHGIGAGIALDRRLYEGEHAAAGEIGFFINAAGNGENLEQTISLPAILEQVEADLAAGQDSMLKQEPEIGFQQLWEAYEKEDPYVQELFRQAGRMLGVAAANIALLLDISMVIFGGIYTVFAESFIGGAAEVIAGTALVRPELAISQFGQSGSLYGCFVRGMEHVMEMYSKEM